MGYNILINKQGYIIARVGKVSVYLGKNTNKTTRNSWFHVQTRWFVDRDVNVLSC